MAAPDEVYKALAVDGPTSQSEPERDSLSERWSPEQSVSALKATLEATADGILVIESGGGVFAYNDRFLELWRIPREFAERTDNAGLLTFVRDQLVDPDSLTRTVRSNVADPEGEYFGKLHFKDGRIYERCSRPQRIGPTVIGRVICFRDVTERERLLEQAHKAVRQRDEFLAIAAHEIRSPITSMQLAVRRLRSDALSPEEQAQLLAILEDEQRRLAVFVDDLLDVGKIRSGQFPPMQSDAVDLAETVRAVIARSREELDDTRTSVVLEVEREIVGLWDPQRLDQVVSNLLSNALKFGKGKPIEIRARAREGWAELTVRDHGIGIAEGLHERIFDQFERGVSERQFGGLGLGLHIAKTIVGALGGTIEVESKVGEGATFVVRLPLEPRE